MEDLPAGKKVRTGVTTILPRGRATLDSPVFGAWFALNGNGEMTGTAWIDEAGQLEGPVVLTNTHSVGVVRDAVISWRVKEGKPDAERLLVVIAGRGRDLGWRPERHQWISRASGARVALAVGGEHRPVAEGNVGGGTGMICHEFKCGIGTASRKVNEGGRDYIVGALVQANYGIRESLRIAGVPVGQNLTGDTASIGRKPEAGEMGSIIIVVATDAPFLPHQLKRIARRAGMGLARMGSFAGNGSGDIFIAFSTANAEAMSAKPMLQASFIVNERIDPFFAATVQATEEAIVNAMVAAKDMQGTDGHSAKALPHDKLVGAAQALRPLRR